MSFAVKSLSFFTTVAVSVYAGFVFGVTSVEQTVSSIDIRGVPEVWERISADYLRFDDYDVELMNDGLIKGLVNSLGDDHSSYFNEEEAAVFTSGLNSELKGIGAELTMRDGFVTVVSPLPGTPAERAGILPGDVIVEVDGKAISDSSSLFEVVMLIRGPEGTSVTLTVVHDGESSPTEITIVRETIHINSVTLDVREFEEAKYGYIKLTQFAKDTVPEFRTSVSSLLSDGVTKLVLDLRFNGGGFLDGAIDVLASFIGPSEVAVITRDRTSDEELSTSSLPLEIFDGTVVVLVNKGSASASEIVAGALQDYGKAVVIGETTFGKGSVQEVIPISDLGLLRLTIAEWLSPKGRSIDKVGIEPDIAVEMPYDKYDTDEDTQLLRAVKELLK